MPRDDFPVFDNSRNGSALDACPPDFGNYLDAMRSGGADLRGSVEAHFLGVSRRKKGKALDFGEAPKAIRLERRQLEALVEYGD